MTFQASMFGIDISKDVFDVALYRTSKRNAFAQFKQNEQGYAQCLKWMKARDEDLTIPAVMEHTGKLWLRLAAALDQEGRKVALLPSDALSPDVRKMFGVKHKTDQQDALVLAQLGLFKQGQQSLRLLDALRPDRQALKEIQRYINTLVERMSGDKMSLQQAQCDELKVTLQQEIDHLSQRIKQLRERLATMVGQDSELKRISELLQTIPGIAFNAALVMMTEIGDINRFASAKELASWAGMSPLLRESGKFKGRSKLPPGGNKRIRKTLHVCSASARVYNPIVKQAYEGLKDPSRVDQDGNVNPLCGMQISSALAHKLLRQIYGVWSSGKAFDPLYLQNRNNPKKESNRS